MKPWRRLDEMLMVSRFRSLRGQAKSRPALGSSFKWYATNKDVIYRNGYQERQREAAFAALRLFRRKRRPTSNFPTAPGPVSVGGGLQIL
jgi:hypothetical protein